MSVSLHLGCLDCKEYIWIGQAGLGESYIYTKEPNIMNQLNDFLHKHMSDGLSGNSNSPSHKLIFTTDHRLNSCDYDGWKNVTQKEK